MLYGPRKIWDSSLAAIGLLWARQAGREVRKAYLDLVYERFWRRELDIEDTSAMAALVAEAGGDGPGYLDYLDGAGRQRHDALQAELHDAGLFGVPSYVVDGEIFFGREHLPMVRWILGGRRGAAPDVAYDRFPGRDGAA